MSEPEAAPHGERRRWGRRVGAMPFLEHVEELRGVLLDSLWAVVAASVVGWFLSERILRLVIEPVGTLVFLGPADALGLRMKTAFLVGAVVASPIILWKAWGFVAPGLLARERRVVGPLVVSSSLLFFAGVLFALAVLAPITMRFLLSFQSDVLKPFLTAGAYFDFLAKMSIAFGVLFQLPIVLGALAWAGIVPPALLVRRWREAVIIVFVVAAILTPPDVVSQMVMALPLLALYVVSVGVAYALGGGRARGRAGAARTRGGGGA